MKTFSLLLTTLVVTFALHLGIASAAQPSISEMARLGQGEVRYLNLIKVYSATLYAKDPAIDSKTSRCLVLEYDVSLKPEDMITAANKVLTKQHSPALIALYQDQIQTLHNSYQKVTAGDYYSLCYAADRQVTTLALNDVVLTTIPSAAFAELYFGIWLSEKHPIDEKLQRQLLSGLARGGRHESS